MRMKMLMAAGEQLLTTKSYLIKAPPNNIITHLKQ